MPAREIVIKHNIHETRTQATGAIATTKVEKERSRHDGLVTVHLTLLNANVQALDTLLATEVMAITFIHWEPSLANPGQLVIQQGGDGLGGGTDIFSTGVHGAVGPFRRTLGKGKPIILASGAGRVDVIEGVGGAGVGGELTISYYMKTIS